MDLRSWLLSARPKTLTASLVPVLIGAMVALQHTQVELIWIFPILIATLLIQIGTNISNDYYDFKKGADTADRIGPVRVTQAGLISPKTVQIGSFVIFIAAILTGIPLVMRGGWIIVAIGLISVLFGILYTAGPYPIAYLGLGELFVLVFFGIIAVSGTAYLLTLEWSKLALLSGITIGMLSISLLAVNNIRDISTDRKAGKNTLAARFGHRFARVEYLLAIFIAHAIGFYLVFQLKSLIWLCIFIPTILLSIEPIKIVFNKQDGQSLNTALAKTARLQLLFGILFSIGLYPF